MAFELLLGLLAALLAGLAIGWLLATLRGYRRVREARTDAVKRSRAVLSGQFSEQLAPYLPDFPWRPTEARFIGKPVDFLIFKGLDERLVDEVVFVEVKTGGSRLSPVEKSLKEAIEAGRVSWAEYRGGDAWRR